ncbi:MAG: phosphatase PAP2 family protein [Armatimonadota bacterium]
MELNPLNLKLFYLINSHHCPALDTFFEVFRWAGHGVFLIPLLALVYKFRRYKLRRLVIGLVISLSIVHIIKNTFPQYRPVLTLGQDNIHLLLDLHGNSFPSADAAMAFTIMGALIAGEHRWLQCVLVLYAAMVAYTRVYLGVHFPLDVTIGAVLGILSTNLHVFYPKSRRKPVDDVALQHHDEEKIPACTR